jgi:hypothetical protein
MPVHFRNIDRHGMGNMKSEEAKAFDRVKVPILLVFFLGFLGMGYFGMIYL